MRKFLVPLLVLLAVFSFGACGRKAPPSPSHLAIPQISDLRARAESNSIVLTWTAPDPRADVAGTRVLRSVLQVPGDCPGCPKTFEAVADLLPGDIKLEKGLASFVDYNVKSGFLYSYRLVLCDSFGMCGAESNTAETRITP